MVRRTIRQVKSDTVTDNETLSKEVQDAFIRQGVIPSSNQTASYQLIPISQIVTWENQPRNYIDQQAINKLAKTIEVEGFKYPCLVRPIEDNKYQIVAGERRYLAAQLALKTEIPCLIENLNDTDALEAALKENLLREDLNPIEVLNSLLRLLSDQLQLSEDDVCKLLYEMKRRRETHQEKKKSSGEINFPNSTDDRYQTVITLFESYGYNWYSYVCSQLKLRNLPKDVYQAIATGQIEYSKGLKFKSIKDDKLRQSLLNEAIELGWSQKLISQKIKQIKESNADPKVLSPSQHLSDVTRRVNQVKPWKTDPKVWKKIQTRLKGIEDLLLEVENNK
ncbi:ParB/RepB/Spo0J family partition protein [Crocosphaera watsonii WH 8501]|uniref:ParB-like partition protein n=1 Tax=Crocosphaera watsonii WH 8501 TaxID=165597 RepID=Q4C995_CROWT|nr:ParB/RepB/Spo0J family partition protein [Crocosphaera watsonii]EAM53391.1 ParB-like partition protein [Crocosphaera watsonii WH 8501]